jgi:hypothetical protein
MSEAQREIKHKTVKEIYLSKDSGYKITIYGNDLTFEAGIDKIKYSIIPRKGYREVKSKGYDNKGDYHILLDKYPYLYYKDGNKYDKYIVSTFMCSPFIQNVLN